MFNPLSDSLIAGDFLVHKVLNLCYLGMIFLVFPRRTFNEQVLHIIKDEGTFSTMHTLLIYLQTALQDQCPVVAGLLLQLDLLVYDILLAINFK